MQNTHSTIQRRNFEKFYCIKVITLDSYLLFLVLKNEMQLLMKMFILGLGDNSGETPVIEALRNSEFHPTDEKHKPGMALNFIFPFFFI